MADVTPRDYSLSKRGDRIRVTFGAGVAVELVTSRVAGRIRVDPPIGVHFRRDVWVAIAPRAVGMLARLSNPR